MSHPQHRILLVGKGGREHALAWKLSHSPSVEHVFVFPGNGGTAKGLPNVSNVNEEIVDYADLVFVSRRLSITLVVVGPDDDVVNGIEGFFRDSGIPCFAPTKQAAETEGSKAYDKDLMSKSGIPTAAYMTFEDIHQAKSYVDSTSHVIVIKASGLAAGKGVVLPTRKEEAHEALEYMMVPHLQRHAFHRHHDHQGWSQSRYKTGDRITIGSLLPYGVQIFHAVLVEESFPLPLMVTAFKRPLTRLTAR
ncbi:hypothetical protein LX36DRAFT_671882 [Colletotrichum falcatum]|nr:hypothetical protein LX36DRAFT_671882 [Colletotrichum falcatum]